MGNGIGKASDYLCCGGFSIGDNGGGRRRSRRSIDVATAIADVVSDEGLGHSFCYVRPDHHAEPAAPLAAAAAGAPSTRVHNSEETTTFRSISGASVSANASTQLTTSDLGSLTWPAVSAAFESSVSFFSVPLQPVPRFPSGSLAVRGFLSGPIERGFMSGPLDPRTAASGPLVPDKPAGTAGLRHGGAAAAIRGVSRAISRAVPSIKRSGKSGSLDSSVGTTTHLTGSSSRTSVYDDTDSIDGGLQWAQGKAGEDRVHVVISEERGWVFVGIYDGFNGPDAPDFLLCNLYPAVHRELEGLLWNEAHFERNKLSEDQCPKPICGDVSGKARQRTRKWRCEWERERSELCGENLAGPPDHHKVLKALSRALKKSEESFLVAADEEATKNPELALMGSCVLVMLMNGDDVYVMNVGDSRAVLARDDYDDGGGGGDDQIDELLVLSALQLTVDHSTCADEEVERIRSEHLDDASAIVNGRVKGSLKVTRAFGAGFLKQPRWNNALLEAFRIDYVGCSPYITCIPSLCYHKLGAKDRFLILSSDGLYQYFNNTEAVAAVEHFTLMFPEGDPAQHLVEECLFRAAKKAGMDFHELLEIPQGDRRRYHDDICLIVISLEGRIWRSCV